MKNITITIFIFILFAANVFSQTSFSKQSVKEDLKYLFTTLDKSAYNLYSKNSKEIFTKEFERILNSLDDSLSMIQIHRLFQSFVAHANDSHCLIDLPISSYGRYLQNGGTLFPLNLYFKDANVYVKNNFTADSTIAQSNEITSINGKPISEVLNSLYNYLSGENNYIKNAKIETISFPRLFWIVNGKSKQFDMGLKQKNGKIKIAKHNSISCIRFEQKMSKIKPIPFAMQEKCFTYIDNIAYLTPGPFYNIPKKGNGQVEINSDVLNKNEFIQFIDSCFSIIKKNETKNLIIDLRGNPGGSAIFSNLMVAYFASEPFVGAEKFYLRTSEISKKFWSEVNDTSKFVRDIKEKIMNREDGTRFEIDGNKYLYQPVDDSLRFKGKVYVLINRFCGSQGIEVPAMIKKYGFGKLIGETTPPLISANARQFKLPNSKITVTYSEASYGDSYMNNGVIPDYKIKDDILTEKDEILDYTLNLIKNRNQSSKDIKQ